MNSVPLGQTGRPRLAFIDGIRALSALYVAAFHAVFTVCTSPGKIEGSGRHIVFLFCFGRYAVDVFIVLSGFCLMWPVARGRPVGEFWGFMRRRARRLLPPYYAALALCTILDLTLLRFESETFWNHSIPVTVADILAHLVLVHDLLPATVMKIDPVFWSVAVEWRISFLFPALVWLGARVPRAQFVLVVGVLGYGTIALLSGTGLAIGWNRDFGAMPHYVVLFALGMLASKALCSEGAQVQTIRWHIAAAIGFGAVLATLMFPGRVSKAWIDSIVGLWAATSLVSLGIGPGPVRRLLELKPLVFCGGFSYSIYLVHGPVLQLLWLHGWSKLRLTPIQSFESLMAVGTPVMLAASFAFYWFFERPFLVPAPSHVAHPKPLEGSQPS